MRILIAEDHPIIIEALTQIINSQFPTAKIFSLESSKAIIEKLITQKIEFLILDIQLLDGNALAVLDDIKNLNLPIKIMVFTTTQISHSYVKYNNGQVWGFVHKNIQNSDLRKVISNFLTQKELHKINSDYFTTITTIDKNKTSKKKIFETLSKNELLVMELLADNNSIKEIASITNKKPNTISTYKKRIFQKLGVKNIIEFINIINK